MENSSDFSIVRFIGQLIAYILAFAIPTTILVMVFKSYAIWILTVSAVLFLAGIGLMVGLEWFDPKAPEEGRRQIKDFALSLSIVMILFSILSRMPIIQALIFWFCISISILSGFYFGRRISKKRFLPNEWVLY